VGAIDFYEAWTGVPQPLPKFDLLAVPGKTGAMENWGLLLFDEFRFLLNHVRSRCQMRYDDNTVAASCRLPSATRRLSECTPRAVCSHHAGARATALLLSSNAAFGRGQPNW